MFDKLNVLRALCLSVIVATFLVVDIMPNHLSQGCRSITLMVLVVATAVLSVVLDHRSWIGRRLRRRP